ACLKRIKADETLRDIPVVMVTMLDDRDFGYAVGASDYITKPVSREQLTAVLRRFRGAAPPGPVLVVEDDADTRQIFRRMLESEGWTVSEAENGRVGMDQVRKQTPELIILDLMMAEMDGFEFLVELR